MKYQIKLCLFCRYPKQDLIYQAKGLGCKIETLPFPFCQFNAEIADIATKIALFCGISCNSGEIVRKPSQLVKNHSSCHLSPIAVIV